MERGMKKKRTPNDAKNATVLRDKKSGALHFCKKVTAVSINGT